MKECLNSFWPLFGRTGLFWSAQAIVGILAVGCGEDGQHTPAKAPVAAAAPVAAPTTAPKAAADSLASFSWETEVCQNTGLYRKGRYTEKQLQSTQALVQSSYLQANGIIWKPEEYTTVHLQKMASELDQEYSAAARKLRAADVLPTPYWQNIKRHRLLELDEIYQLEKLSIKAYLTPEVLLDSPFGAGCNEFATALTSPDTAVTMQAWRTLQQAQKLKNGAPEQLQAQYDAEAESPDRLIYAKIELLTFGWRNCALDHQKQGKFFENKALDTEFEKLFKKVKSECDDVD